MARNIYIFRHGETDYNVQKRMQGYLDIPLNANGIAQAQDLAHKLSYIKLDCIYSSPLSRAMETAKIVAQHNNIKVIPKNGLSEWNLGTFCGHIVRLTEDPKDTPLNLSSDIVYVPRALIKDDDFIPEKGESYNMFKKRILETMMEIMKNTAAKNIGIASHSGVVKVLIQEFTNWKLERGGMPNAGYFKMQWDNKQFSVPEKPNWLIAQQSSKNICY